MKSKISIGITLTLLLMGMLTLAFNFQPAKADWTWTETIYIRADGSVEPDTAPILTVDNITYTFTDNIIGDFPWGTSVIVVERDNIVVDGASYTVQGIGGKTGTGIDLSDRSNVTLKNVEITNLHHGISLYNSSNNALTDNTASNNYYGIYLNYSSNNNVIKGNNVSSNQDRGIYVYFSSNNNIITNNDASNNLAGIHLQYSSNNNVITDNNVSSNIWSGIELSGCHNNIITGNNVSSNQNRGIYLWYSNDNTLVGNTASKNLYGIFFWSTNSTFFHNNFINNTVQALAVFGDVNTWDDGYPSGGNYWSGYTGLDLYSGSHQNATGSDGIGDTPYFIDEDNQDNYPLMEAWSPLPRTIDELKTEIEELGSEGEIDNQGIIKSLLAKLNVAQKLVDKGKVDKAEMVLEGFIMQVQKLSGIHIPVEAADILIQSAEYIISKL